MLFKSFGTVPGTRDRNEEVWAEKVLLQFWCLMRRESDSRELAFLQYMEGVPSSNEAREAVRCVCRQWATAASAEEKHDAE